MQRVNRTLRRIAGAAAPGGGPEGNEAAAIRAIVAARRLAQRRFGAEVGDIAWILLLEAYAARLEGQALAVTRLGAAGGVSRSTAHRWARWLIDRGLLAVQPGVERRRATFVALSDDAARRVSACLAEARAVSRP